ncbi:unnamed protein product, partial [Ectocarpus sp. 12 AP-2014]
QGSVSLTATAQDDSYNGKNLCRTLMGHGAPDHRVLHRRGGVEFWTECPVSSTSTVTAARGSGRSSRTEMPQELSGTSATRRGIGRVNTSHEEGQVRQEDGIARASTGLPRDGPDRAADEHCLALEQQSEEPSSRAQPMTKPSMGYMHHHVDAASRSLLHTNEGIRLPKQLRLLALVGK